MPGAGGGMDKRTYYLTGAGMVAVVAAFSMTINGPQHAFFLLMMAAFLGLRAQREPEG
jgi:hypothetical protein